MEYDAHEGLKAGRRSPDYVEARERWLARREAKLLRQKRIRKVMWVLVAIWVVWALRWLVWPV